jgi:hypothetical protein
MDPTRALSNVNLDLIQVLLTLRTQLVFILNNQIYRDPTQKFSQLFYLHT